MDQEFEFVSNSPGQHTMQSTEAGGHGARAQLVKEEKYGAVPSTTARRGSRGLRSQLVLFWATVKLFQGTGHELGLT
jgi:hypothetical protein